MEAQLEEKNQELQRVTFIFLYLAAKMKACYPLAFQLHHPSYGPCFVSGEAEGEDE